MLRVLARRAAVTRRLGTTRKLEVSNQQLFTALHLRTFSKDELRTAFDAADANRDGSIDCSRAALEHPPIGVATRAARDGEIGREIGAAAARTRDGEIARDSGIAATPRRRCGGAAGSRMRDRAGTRGRGDAAGSRGLAAQAARRRPSSRTASTPATARPPRGRCSQSSTATRTARSRGMSSRRPSSKTRRRSTAASTRSRAPCFLLACRWARSCRFCPSSSTTSAWDPPSLAWRCRRSG